MLIPPLKSDVRSNQGPVSEPSLLGTNVVLPLGLMVPGPSVETKEVGQGEVGTVRLIKSERVPSCCGVVVEAEIQGCKGTVMVEQERMLG